MSDFDDFGNSDDGFDFPDDDDGVFPGDDDDGDGFPSGSDGEMQAELTPEEELKNEYDIAKAEEDDAEAIRALMAIVDREEEVLGEKGKRYAPAFILRALCFHVCRGKLRLSL